MSVCHGVFCVIDCKAKAKQIPYIMYMPIHILSNSRFDVE